MVRGKNVGHRRSSELEIGRIWCVKKAERKAPLYVNVINEGKSMGVREKGDERTETTHG